MCDDTRSSILTYRLSVEINCLLEFAEFKLVVAEILELLSLCIDAIVCHSMIHFCLICWLISS